MSVWSEVLDCCPGLLCCVINIKGRLIYATHGYKATASRLFGHKCEEGRNYPPLITELDKAIHEALTAACLGTANAMEITQRGNVWELSASPLTLEGKISGVVLKISLNSAQNLPPVIKSNPDILNSVPFRACTADSKGVILAANKFLSESLGVNPEGSNIAQILEPTTHSELLSILAERSGSAGCLMQNNTTQNFFSASAEELYLDENYNKIESEKPVEQRRIILHASPIEWDGKESVLLTFEDVTESSRAQEQLRRLMTFDDTTGLLNQRGLRHLLRKDFPEAVRNSQHLCLIALGIDGLAKISENLGYSATEKVIRRFVMTMKSFIEGRAECAAAVWSRGEFLVIAHCPGAVAVVLANEIRERADNVKLSAGIADLSDAHFSGTEDFISSAFDALLQARIDGGNKTVLAEK